MLVPEKTNSSSSIRIAKTTSKDEDVFIDKGKKVFMTVAIVNNPTKDMVTSCVLAPGGLVLREKSSIESSVIDTIPYGECLQLKTNIKGKEITVNQLQGKMVRTTYKSQTGYVFSRYLSQFLSPEKYAKKEYYYRRKDLENYADKLIEEGIDVQYQNLSDESEFTESIEFSNSTFQEVFLIAKNIPPPFI